MKHFKGYIAPWAERQKQYFKNPLHSSLFRQWNRIGEGESSRNQFSNHV